MLAGFQDSFSIAGDGRGVPFSSPGEILSGWLEDLGMSQTAFAAHIGISRVMLSRILHGHAALTADMDLRLAEALGTSSGFWLRLQVQRDLWEAAQRASLRPSIPLLSSLR